MKRTIYNLSENGKIAVLTAYDYPTAKLLDGAGVDIILVGDSLGNVILGHKDTLPVTMDDMLRHTKAAARGVSDALLVADMPFMSYQVCVRDAVFNAGRLVKEGGANAVKLEGGAEICEQIRAVTAAGIPVMGHIGLTPQSVNALGGYKIQGKTPEAAKRLIETAKEVEAAGVFSIVLECVPAELAAEITATVSVPTIGIGAGDGCSGQVLVFHDLVGLSEKPPKFAKQYFNAREAFTKAVGEYISDVKKC